MTNLNRRTAPDVKTILDVFSSLDQKFGAQLGPLFCPLEQYDRLDETIFSQLSTRDEHQALVQTYCNELYARQGLSRFPVQTVLLSKSLPRLAKHKELSLPHQTAAPERYYTDSWGRPVAYIEPERIEERGYISLRLARIAAQLLLMSVQDSSLSDRRLYPVYIAATAGFIGYGEIMCAFDDRGETLNNYIALLLYWRCQGKTPEQIRSSMLMRKPHLDLKSLDIALAGLSDHDTEIVALRAKMTARSNPLKKSA